MDKDAKGSQPGLSGDVSIEERDGRDSWVDVRDSWVGDRVSPEPGPPPAPPPPEPPPPSDRLRSAPPPLPPSQRPAALDAAGAERRERLTGVMLERLAASDYDGAMIAAAVLLDEDPEHPDAVQTMDIASRELLPLYEARLGSLDAVPKAVAARDPLAGLRRPPDETIVLAQVDGESTCRQIAHAVAMPRIQALRVLSELVLRGDIEL